MRHSIRGVCMLASAFAFCMTPGGSPSAREPTLNEALAAPASELIQSYMFTHSAVHGSIPLAQAGITVYLGNDKITQRNAGKKLETYRRRLEIYTEAINRRGFEDVSGRYTGTSTESRLVLMDPLNSDYYINGRIEDGRIKLSPDTRVLDAWPGWAGPPDRRDIEDCRVELVAL